MTGAVTAVVPVFNGREMLASLLDSIAAQTAPFAEVVVVDNGSTDDAAALAASRGCRVVRMGHNAGFARAVNRGWQEAKTPWVAILNSDVVLDPDWLNQCLPHRDGNAFITGILLQADDPGIIDGTYDLLSRAGCAWRAGNGQPAVNRTGPVPISVAPGTACLFRRDVLAELGGFEEGFESYLEDVDLGLRCVRAGHSGVYVPAARATHRGSATFGAWNGRVVRLISRNQLLLIFRHYDRGLLRRWLWPIIAGQLLWGLVALRHGSALVWAKGKWEALRRCDLSARPSARLQAFIENSEAELHRCAQDSYWRWYFRLTRLPSRTAAD